MSYDVRYGELFIITITQKEFHDFIVDAIYIF